MLFIIYINDMPTSVLSSIYTSFLMMPRSTETFHRTTTLPHSSTTFSNWRNGQRDGSYVLTQTSVRSCTSVDKTPVKTTPWAEQRWLQQPARRTLACVDTKLTFEKHIETVVNQANRMLGLIRRSYTYLDSQSLLKLYTSLVRPTLEYANAAWNPILRRDQILLENVQRRATKLIPVLRDRVYEDRLRTLKLPSLYTTEEHVAT